ncbi:hypothetical protein LQ938_00060 [Microbacterium sp. cx-55]|uniref:hypothetical protein n=1 Tax=unclassified Microbacterium TaxID=2609290 RepID=UPI001CBAB498|nr:MULTISPECIES: hypothetical protein [unclassified Microbacterium]MBZ4487197.1 hypothetical protein [Microbacterium sp. cx-55]MCC4908685.1 hypothetical protein [Microbacterium sp. cx-59]UGB35222.1 hypothetical protein LQ938_00060 [Microbacterium sp. cx-55]
MSFDDVYADPDEVLARVEADARRSEERAAKMPAFEAALAQVRGEAVSPRRDIRLEVDSTGRVTALRISEPALGRGAQRLSHEILGLIRAAEADSRRATLESVEQLLGPDDPITRQLRSAGPTA